MTWWVYILKSKKSGSYYIGSTDSKERRLNEHNRGKNKFTRNRGPWKIVYTEKFSSRKEARRRERKIKSYKGGNEFKKLLKI